ncbi:MAG: hypothetical protein MI861_04055 [Pirellulales bacterium]|nr:hypothetical protein [Pirellulales bacterium]
MSIHRLSVLITLLVLTSVSVGSASAQSGTRFDPMEMFAGGRAGAATADESIARGVAEVVVSSARAELLAAQARTENAKAHALQLEGRLTAINTYFKGRRLNQEARFGHLRRPVPMSSTSTDAPIPVQLSPPELHDASTDLFADMRKQTDRLEPSELDLISGEIQWPLLLQTRHFERARQPVDHVFAQRAVKGRINPDHYVPLRRWLKAIQAELQEHVQHVPREDFVEASRFLRRLGNEARYAARKPMDPMKLAAHRAPAPPRGRAVQSSRPHQEELARP